MNTKNECLTLDDTSTGTPDPWLRHPSAMSYCIIALTSLIMAGAFLAVNIRYTGTIYPASGDGDIYLAYARNFADGNFFQYNIGEYSSGTTSFLWPWFLGAAYAAGRCFFGESYFSLVLSAHIVGVMCLLGTSILTYWLGRRLLKSECTALLIALLVALDYRLIWGTLSALEVPLVALVLVATLLRVQIERQTNRFPWSSILLGLLALSRPEGVWIAIVIYGLLVLEAIYARMTNAPYSPSAVRVAACIVCSVLIALIQPVTFVILTGKPFPASYYSKVGEFSFSSVLHLGFAKQVIYWLNGYFFEYHETRTSFTGYAFAFLVLLFGTVRAVFLRKVEWLYVCLTVILYFVARAGVAPGLGSVERYVSFIDPLILLLVGWLLAGPLFDDLCSALTGLTSRAVRCGMVPLAAGSILLPVIASDLAYARYEYVVYVSNMNDGYGKMADYVKANLPNAVIAVEAAGFKARVDNRLVDIVGLATPALNNDLYRKGEWRDIWSYLRSRRVDYLIFYPEWFENPNIFHRALKPEWLTPIKTFIVPNARFTIPTWTLYKIDWERYVDS